MASLWPLFASLPFLLGTYGQMTDAVCIDSYAWAYNSYGQSPCMVAAYLQQQCNSAPVNIPALHQNTLYATLASNASDSSCQCSSVVYSLISACASCQLGNYVSWSAWSLNCTTVYMNAFPKAIPPETDVPVWAYKLDLAKGIAFNVTTARLLAAGTSQSTANERNASPSVSPVVYGAVGAACAFALVLLIGGGVFLWRRRHAYRIGEMVPQKYSPLYETNPAASLYVGNRPHSADYSYKAVSVPSTPPIITEFRHSRHLAPAPSVRSAVSLPSLYSPGDSHEYSPAVESSQGTAHGEHSNIMVSGEDVVLSPVCRSPVTPVYRPESSLSSPLEAPSAS